MQHSFFSFVVSRHLGRASHHFWAFLFSSSFCRCVPAVDLFSSRRRICNNFFYVQRKKKTTLRRWAIGMWTPSVILLRELEAFGWSFDATCSLLNSQKRIHVSISNGCSVSTMSWWSDFFCWFRFVSNHPKNQSSLFIAVHETIFNFSDGLKPGTAHEQSGWRDQHIAAWNARTIASIRINSISARVFRPKL